MELVILVIVIALFQYIWFSARVGMGRVKYQVKAPAITGHPQFERLYRVQMNTLEQLILFLPAMLAFSWLGEQRSWPAAEIAAALGVVWIIGRGLYARSYVRDPEARGPGFLLSFLPSCALLLGSVLLVLLAAL
jgi:glutathione S-transferase